VLEDMGGISLERKIFSIITPTYNCAAKIKKTIESVLSQNKSLFEYIIVDGLSDDGTSEEIEKYSDEIKLIVGKDKGVYDAMNKGIDIASGNYLYFLGAGDQLKEGILEKIKPIMPQDGLSFVYGNVYRLDHNRIYDGQFKKHKLSKRNICHQAIFYERNIFDLVGKYDLKFRTKADYALNLRCFGCREIDKIYVNEVIAEYEGFGLSSDKEDEDFMKEKPKLIKECLGNKEYIFFELRSVYVKILKKLKS
jgi:glycosyltransferase involved in cell wall biosynthesis